LWHFYDVRATMCAVPQSCDAPSTRQRNGHRMATYRLVFYNHQSFDVVIQARRAEPGPPGVISIATIHRVVEGKQEREPLHRATGGPLEVFAVSADTALAITTEVLRELTGSDVERQSELKGEGAFFPTLDPI